MATVNPNQPIHPKFDERISVRVEGQLPQFVKEDHATFVAFLEAYYEYMEQEGKPYEIIGNLNNYANLDKTTDEFLNHFKKQFGEDIPEAVFANANKPFVLKHLRDFYRTKGSEKAFQFLFRLLHKEEIDFYYPGRDMLRTSDGKYGKSEVIRVIDTSSSDDVFKMVGKTITGATSGASALVETVLNESIGAYTSSTMFLSGVIGDFSAEENITDGTYTFATSGILVDTTITNPGTLYSVNDVIPLVGGGVGTGGLVSVKELTAGKIISATISAGGYGYKIGDKLTIDNTDCLDINGRSASIIVSGVNGTGAITKLDIENSGRGYIALPTVTGGGSGNGCAITIPATGTGIGGIKSLKINRNGFQYTATPTLDFSAKGSGDAVGTIIVGGLEKEYGVKFTGTDGFLSSDKYIQDSLYYQLFSYVITSGHTIDKWRDVVKRVAHPAGLAMFGNFQIISMIDMRMELSSIPQAQHYTIIFHDGTIQPPVILDLKVDSCGPTQNQKIYLEAFDYNKDNMIFGVEDVASEDFGLVSDSSISAREDYGDVTISAYYIAPTKCQIYEKDLGIQTLRSLTGFDDYLFTNIGHTRTDDDGLVTSAATSTEDWGTSFHPIESYTQKRLGQLQRYVDRQKFRKQGGYSQTIGVGQQSGMIISNFKDVEIWRYIYNGGLQTRLITNSTITQYQTGNEASSLPPAP